MTRDSAFGGTSPSTGRQTSPGAAPFDRLRAHFDRLRAHASQRLRAHAARLSGQTVKALRKLAAEDTHLELVEMPAPTVREDWVLLDVIFAGICGTDDHIMHNQFPSYPPVTLGHEFLGRVAATGPGVDSWRVGDRVVCEPHSLADTTCHLCRRGLAHLCAAKRSPGWGIDGGMAEQVLVPQHLLHRVPDHLSDRAAGLCEPTAIVVTAVERMPIDPGSTVLVFGPGPIGLLSAMVARACGAGQVVLVGRSSSAQRLDVARDLGFDVWNSDDVDVATEALAITGGRGVDQVIETSGSAAATTLAITALRRRGKLCVLGVSSAPTIEIPWGLAMNRALDVAFSLSSSWSSWDAALALMGTGKVDPEPLATVFSLSRWPDAFQALADRTAIKALLDPQS